MPKTEGDDFYIPYDLDEIFKQSAEAKAFYAAVEKAKIDRGSANIALGLYGLDCEKAARLLGIKLEPEGQ